MPSALLKPCTFPGGCPELTPGGPCVRHRREREQRRGSAASRGYDSRWARYSQAWIRKHPRCGERADGQLHAEHSKCVQASIITALGMPRVVMVTDHIRASKQGGAFWDSANHQTLCRRCNTVKAIELEGGLRR
jgi:5-methylcytosine-specific restriction protein A